MQITVEVDDGKVTELVKKRIGELFSDDARYRNTGVQDLVRAVVDDAAVSAIREARNKIAGELPAIAESAVRRAIQGDIENAAKRGMGALRKLYAGFDPTKLLPEQRLWLERQIAMAADNREDVKP